MQKIRRRNILISDMNRNISKYFFATWQKNNYYLKIIKLLIMIDKYTLSSLIK